MPPALTRFPDWTDRLQTYLDRVRETPFEWGRHDCILFVCGAVKAITGHDFAAKVPRTYATRREAALALRERFSGTLAATMTGGLGEPVHVAQAGRGDIAMKSKAVGVVVSHGWAWFVGEEPFADRDGSLQVRKGLVAVPVLHCEAAWKVAPVVTAA